MRYKSKQLEALISNLTNVTSIKPLTTDDRLALQKYVKDNQIEFIMTSYADKSMIVWQDPDGLDYGWLWKGYYDVDTNQIDVVQLKRYLTSYTLKQLKRLKKRSLLITHSDKGGNTYYTIVENCKLKSYEEAEGFTFAENDYGF